MLVQGEIMKTLFSLLATLHLVASGAEFCALTVAVRTSEGLEIGDLVAIRLTLKI